MNLKLYEYTELYQRLQDIGEEGLDIEAALATVQEDFNTKAENVAKVIRSLEAEAKAYQDEINRLNQAAQARANRGQRLKDYLRQNMEALNLDTV